MKIIKIHHVNFDMTIDGAQQVVSKVVLNTYTKPFEDEAKFQKIVVNTNELVNGLFSISLLHRIISICKGKALQ
jgi:hypothetical protein